MLSRFTAAMLILVCGAAPAQQPGEPRPYTDSEAYRVYDALLAKDSFSGASLVIHQETFAKLSDPKLPFAVGPEACVTPAAAVEFKEAISDYIRVNQQRWLLQRKFSLERSYDLLDRKREEAIFQNGGWEDYRQRFANSQGLFQMSAVGFNHDKTRAIVYFGYVCGTLCGQWDFRLLRKIAGRWQDDRRGVTCSTIS